MREREKCVRERERCGAASAETVDLSLRSFPRTLQV
jgi:hypothetical protein